MPLARPRMGCRKVKRQRGERVHYPKVASVLAVNGLYPNDADDDFGGYTQLGLRALQCVAVGLPKLHARADANGLNKAAAV